MQPPDPDSLCCELSAAMNEPMAGTAVTAAVWLMLEYTRPWGAKATEENELPTPVSRWLGEQARAVNGRLQLIRQFRADAEFHTFFVGVNHETAPRLYEFHLTGYEALLALDLASVVAGDGRFASHLVAGPRYFVCTNGKRDKSCAVYGAALYRAMAEKARAAVWMTTHLGGHRFAGTLLTLPDGVCYGRLHPQDIDQFLTASQQGELWLEKLRGRTLYGPVEQFAEACLRQETGQRGLDAFRWVKTVDEGNGRWQLTFQSKENRIYHIAITSAEPISVYANSGQLKAKETPQFQLITISP